MPPQTVVSSDDADAVAVPPQTVVSSDGEDTVVVPLQTEVSSDGEDAGVVPLQTAVSSDGEDAVVVPLQTVVSSDSADAIVVPQSGFSDLGDTEYISIDCKASCSNGMQTFFSSSLHVFLVNLCVIYDTVIPSVYVNRNAI